MVARAAVGVGAALVLGDAATLARLVPCRARRQARWHAAVVQSCHAHRDCRLPSAGTGRCCAWAEQGGWRRVCPSNASRAQQQQQLQQQRTSIAAGAVATVLGAGVVVARAAVGVGAALVDRDALSIALVCPCIWFL